ncbi:MAG TPA: deoxyribodipyrimidine photo-lyase, partial [Candidatus Polarisedimenticolia bacterium]|nr:deoxyribodipyrimidine photo-lyase [Candidatus Polarisedimenticolia bacterium]
MTRLTILRRDPRVTVRGPGEPDPEGRCVVYWMQRAQRALDNPALDTAIVVANELRLPVAVFFGLHPRYPGANLRHYTFLAEGLPVTARGVERRGAAFVLKPYPEHDLTRFCREVRAALVVGDENPLRQPEAWREAAARKLAVPLWTVEADVVVPTRLFLKEEYAARTLRPKIAAVLDGYLKRSTNPKARVAWPPRRAPLGSPVEDPGEILAGLRIDRSAGAVVGYRGGTAEALRRLRRFVRTRLSRYHLDRNKADLAGTSELSAHLHFGQIGPHTVARAVKDAAAPRAAKDAFLEELIVRRELAVNFVARNSSYDSLAGCHEWA